MTERIEVPGNWICNGAELKPKSGANSTNTWVVENKKARPKTGATSANTYDVGDLPILVIAGKLALRLW